MPQSSLLDHKAVVDRTPPDPSEFATWTSAIETHLVKSRESDSWGRVYSRALEHLERLSQTGTGPVYIDRAENQVEEASPPIQNTALQNLIECWAEVAASHAVTRRIDDPPGLIATVAGIEGAWGIGNTLEEALRDLESVLNDWAALKLRDGDEDIPSMEGVHLVIER